jgi:TonB-dependent starch-binding outer membrane protein SusC
MNPVRSSLTRLARRLTRTALAGLGVFAVAAMPLQAQQGGTIAGRVTDATTAGPVNNAQVVVAGVNRGTLTDAQGNFVLVNVPAGEHQLQVRSVGFRSFTRSVQVAAGGTTRLDIELSVSAVALDEIVVSGRATGTARREIGSSMAGINVADLETAPVSSMSQLLQARAPGVNILPAGGQAGQGSRIMLRGIASISQSNTPVVYVDGVRMDNSSYAGIRTTGPSWSGFDDINPQDIESIEIIRGASAATLYGTEAAAGVINITTRRGRTGAARWDLRSEYGVNSTPRSWWRESSSVYADWTYDNLISSGTYHNNQLSISGGQEGFRYYASGTLRGNGGIQPNSQEDYGAFRSNFEVFPRENMTLGFNAGYTQRNVMVPPNANNQEGFINNALLGGPLGNWNPPLNLVALEMYQNGTRFTGGVTAEYRPGNFIHRATAGTDIFNADNTEFLPPEVVSRFSGGYAGVYRRSARNFNLDLASTYRRQLSDRFRTTTSVGFQAYRSEVGTTAGYGEDFPFIGLRVVDATASGYSVGESRGETRSVGFFGEQQFGFDELFFLTFGARADGHSAFGEEVDYQIYPKVDASYVVSQHAFWDERLGTLRLRGAYGTAGMQPSAFSAVRTWSATSAAGGIPAIVSNNVGNPELRPEVSRELELGFDAGLLNERLNVELTYYNQRTTDALYQARNIPSLGFLGTQLRNIGEVSNSGLELGTRLAVVELPTFSWHANANLSTNRNRVVSLGGEAPNQVRWLQHTREGFPIAGFFAEDHLIVVDGQVVNKRDYYGDGPGTLTDEQQYIGPPTPTRTVQLGSTMTFLRDINFGFLFDHQGGHYRTDHTLRWLVDPRRTVPAANREIVPPGEGPRANFVSTICRGAEAGSLDAAMCDRNSLIDHGEFVVPADFWKLREVTLSYRLPETLSQRFGSAGTTVSLAGRNLWRWMATPSLEPEANLDSQSTLQRQTYFDTPIPRQVVVGVNVQF